MPWLVSFSVPPFFFARYSLSLVLLCLHPSFLIFCVVLVWFVCGGVLVWFVCVGGEGGVNEQRISEAPGSSEDLRKAVSAMDQVSRKLLEAIDLKGELRQGKSRAEPSARRAHVLSRVEAELGRFSNIISHILGDATVNSLPLARLLRTGGRPPVVALDIGGTLTKIVLLERTE